VTPEKVEMLQALALIGLLVTLTAYPEQIVTGLRDIWRALTGR
jgi:hypothetical protein